MRPERYFEKGEMPSPTANPVLPLSPMPLNAFVFGPVAANQSSQWAEIYRRAYEQTVAALRPTSYDRAMKATTN